MTERIDHRLVERGRQPARMLTSQPIRTGHFNAGRSYSCKRWSGTDDWLLFCTVAGAGRFGHAQGSIETTAGELILLAPRHPHDYATATPPGRWEFTWAHFLPAPNWLPWLAWPTEAPGVHRITLGETPLFATIALRLREMDALATSERHHRFALAQNALEAALLLADEAHPARLSADNDCLRRVADAVCADLTRTWTVDKLAHCAQLSASRFAHRFRAEFGETPRRWVERQRIERARQLLAESSDPIHVIAAAVGFSDPFHFTNRFRAATGQAPSKARQQK